MRNNINGILLLDKPAGFTSNGALQRVKRLFNAKKAGHTGSLDPIATGMLPLCFGEATKFSQFLLDADKSYYVTAKLGVQTNTGDSEGEIVATKPVVNVTHERITQMMSAFIGEIEQVPPMFSALKYQGQPLYELARKGIEVERKARRINIFSIELENLTDDTFTFHVHCSKGTYVRTLVEEMGNKLGCGAHVIGLRRTAVAPYNNIPMLTLETLESLLVTNGYSALLNCLCPIETAVQTFPAVKLSSSATFYLRQGQPVRTTVAIGNALVRLYSDDERFLGIGEVLPDGRVKPSRMVVMQQANAGGI